MAQTFAKTRKCAILGIVLFAAIFAVGLNSSQVSADPCTAQLGYPVMAAQQYSGYYGSSVQLTVPVSATCYFQAGQLYAVGTAYDTTYNTNVGTANTVLSATYESNSFSGQLLFNLPVSVQTHSVQFSVSIYNTQTGYQPYYNGLPLTTTSATYVVTPSTYQSSYPYYPGYNYYYGSYPYYNQNPGNYYYSNNNGGYYYNNQNPGNNYYSQNNNNNGGYYYNNQNPGYYYHNWNGGYHNNNQNHPGYYYNNNNNRQCNSNNQCTHP